MTIQAMMTRALARSIQAHEWAARYGDMTLVYAAQEAQAATERLFILARPYFADEVPSLTADELPPDLECQPQPPSR